MRMQKKKKKGLLDYIREKDYLTHIRYFDCEAFGRVTLWPRYID